MRFLINFNRGHHALCPHALFHLNWTLQPALCLRDLWAISILYACERWWLVKSRKTNTKRALLKHSKCMTAPCPLFKNNWNAASHSPPRANNVLAKCRPTHVNSRRRRRGFWREWGEAWLFVSSGGCRWRSPVYSTSGPAVPHQPGSDGGGSVTVRGGVLNKWVTQLNQRRSPACA